MKKISIALLALSLTFSGFAQKKHDRLEKRNDKKELKHNRFKNSDNFKKLNLTDAQKSDMKSINENFRQQMKDLRQQGNITVNEQKQRREALVTDRKNKINAILTPEQKSQAAEAIKDHRQGRKKGMRNNKFEDVAKDLNLTTDQSAKMATIQTNFRKDIQSIRQNNSLDKEQKKQQIMSLAKQHKSDVQALLTNDQKQQLKDNQKNRPNRTIVK